MYEFNLGEIGLALLACQVGAPLSVTMYFFCLKWYMMPDNIKNSLRQQEHRLVVDNFLILQSIFVYIPLLYPKYAASLFSENGLVRSAMAAGSILYARPLL